MAQKKSSDVGNILSFRFLIDPKGNLVTELSYLPEEDAHKVFDGDDLVIVQKILQEGHSKLDKMHEHLEAELDAFR